MKKTTLLFLNMLALFMWMGSNAQEALITGYVDSPCPGADGRTVEIYVSGTVDFSGWNLTKQSNGNGFSSNSDISAFGSITDQFVYVTNDETSLDNEFDINAGNSTIIENGSISDNGDDAFQLSDANDNVIDRFGEDGVDGTGTDWEHEDSYYYRNDGESANTGSFDASNWTFGDLNLLDGEGTCNESEPLSDSVPFGAFDIEPDGNDDCTTESTPWSNGFENGAEDNTVTSDMDCWNLKYEEGDTDWTFYTSSYLSSGLDPHNGTLMAGFQTSFTGNATKLISPKLDVSNLDSPQLTFFYALISWVGDIDELRVYYKESASDDEWTLIPEAEYTADQETWMEVQITLPNAQDKTDYQIAFEASSNYAKGVYLDDISVADDMSGCSAPTDISFSNTDASSTQVDWTENDNATEWEVLYGESGFDPETEGTSLNVTEAADTTLSDLTASTDYEVYVRAVCSEDNLSEWAGPESFTTSTDDNGYCSPTYSNGCDDEQITNVTLIGESNDIDNTSQCSTNAYGDYTDLTPADLEPGEDYTLSVITNAGNLSFVDVRAWIDYNDDNEFEQGEEIFNTAGAGFNESGTSEFTFTVSENSNPGEYRMRIRLVFGGYDDIDPCSDYDLGETEDYTIETTELADCTGTPSAGEVENASFSICAGKEFDLSVTGASDPANGLQRNWQSSPAGQNDWSDISNANSPTYTVEDGINEETDFRYHVTCNNSNEEDISGIIEVGLNPENDCYCTPTYATGCAGDKISNINLAGDSDVIDNDSQCSENAYGDYTDLTPADLTVGQEYTLSVTTDYAVPGSEECRAWIDYNQNGNFDDSEEIANTAGNGFDDSGTSEFTFSVPEEFVAGDYRMRVRLVYSGGDNISPCASEDFGETEDYSITIETLGVDDYSFESFSFYPNPVKGQLNLKANTQIESVVLFNLRGQRVLENSPNAPQGELNTQGLSAGVYLMKVSIDGNEKTFRVIKE